MEKYSEGLIEIGKLALSFAKVNRITFHEDGIRSESDTDHTVMLALCASSLADALYKDILDVGIVAQFAIVHDLVEVYAGDTNSINLSKEGKNDKDKKEQESLTKIKLQFEGVYPWIHTTIESYESLATKEARFVKALDKAMTKITNTLDCGAAIKKHNLKEEDFFRHYETQREYLVSLTKEFPELMDIFDLLTKRMVGEIYGKGHGSI